MEIYLDNSATTRPSEAVVEAMLEGMRQKYYNPSALYAPAMTSEKELTRARQAIGAALGADEKNVILTSGGTESDNLAIFGYLQTLRSPGPILFSAAEHAAVKNACAEAAHRFGTEAKEIPLTTEGLIDLDALKELLTEGPSLLCVMQVCNETGVIMPIGEICALRDQIAPRAAIHVDGVQGFLRVPFSMKKCAVQSYALSGHKIHGPKGVGALVVQKGHRVIPQILGGGQQENLRSGTEDVYGIMGLRAAVETYPADAETRMREIKIAFVNRLREALPETTVVGLPPEDPRSVGHILSVAFPPVRAETLLHALEGEGILVGTGSACSSKKGKHSKVLTAMKCSTAVMDGAIRVSLCPENTEEELDTAAEAIIRQVTLLRRYSRR